MEKFLGIVAQCSLFNEIEENTLLKMLECLGARVDFFDKKYTIMAERSPAKYIGIVLSGSAQIMYIDYYGNRSILGEIGPAEIFAEAFACLPEMTLPISVVANEPSWIMFIDSDRILHTCSNNCGFHRQLIYNLMQNLAEKNISFHQRIEITSKRSTRDKLLTYLMLQAKRQGSNSFDIPFDRQELADYLEVDRSGLSAQISQLRQEGVLRCRKNHFELL